MDIRIKSMVTFTTTLKTCSDCHNLCPAGPSIAGKLEYLCSHPDMEEISKKNLQTGDYKEPWCWSHRIVERTEDVGYIIPEWCPYRKQQGDKLTSAAEKYIADYPGSKNAITDQYNYQKAQGEQYNDYERALKAFMAAMNTLFHQ